MVCRSVGSRLLWTHDYHKGKLAGGDRIDIAIDNLCAEIKANKILWKRRQFRVFSDRGECVQLHGKQLNRRWCRESAQGAPVELWHGDQACRRSLALLTTAGDHRLSNVTE